MTSEEFQLFERRIDNCWRAAELAQDADMREMWIQNAMALLRKMNYKLNGSVAQLD